MRRLLAVGCAVIASAGLWFASEVGAAPVVAEQLEKASNDLQLRATVVVIPDAVARAEPAPSWSADACESLRWDMKTDKLRRVRQNFDSGDRREMRRWLDAAAREFEPRDAQNLARFLKAFASSESSYRPGAVHVLSADQKAAQIAGSRVFVGGHEHAAATITIWTDETLTTKAWGVSAWMQSRGLYGMAPGLWLRSDGRWGADVPPWALCDRATATTLLVWSARAAMRECKSLGFPATYRTLKRRLSSGHCRERAAKFERAWTSRARDQGLDPDALVGFTGKRWPELGSDRAKLLRRFRAL